MTNKNNKGSKSLLSINETADRLGICSQTLRNWEKREDFPFSVRHTLGGHRRYSTEEVEEFLSNKTKETKGVLVCE